MTGWQPIETAPRDGAAFLALDARSKSARVVYYDDDAKEKLYPWHVEDAATGFNHHQDFFTHWMPLPEPPKESE